MEKNENNFGAQWPKIKENECGDDALRKMMHLCPQDLKRYILWNNDIQKKLFRPKQILTFEKRERERRIKTRAVVVCRVSTCIQDPASPFKQALSLVELQKRDPDFDVIGVLVDFFVNGRQTKGRQFWDTLLKCLIESPDEGLAPVFNAIATPEITRLSRRASMIFDVAEWCAYFGIKLIERNNPYDLADPKNIATLASKAADSQNEIARMGGRMADSKNYNFLRFKTLPGNHFGFEVVNTFDIPNSPRRRVINSCWEKKDLQFRIYQFIFPQFMETPNYCEVAKATEKRFGVNLNPAHIERLLQSPHAIGLHYKPPHDCKLNPDTERIEDRTLPIPEAIANDLSQCDAEPYKYFIPALVVTDVETYRRVQELIARKRSKIRTIPGNNNRGHRPKAEGGKSAFSGIVFCGMCGEPYILAGPSGGPRQFACAGCRRKKKKCEQHRYIREDVLYTFVMQGIEHFLQESFPQFYAEYCREREKHVQAIASESQALSAEKVAIQRHIENLLLGIQQLSKPNQIQMESLIQEKTEHIQKLEAAMLEQERQKRFLEGVIPFDKQAVREYIPSLENLFKGSPIAANEALRTIFSRIEIHEVDDVDGHTATVQGRLFVRQEGLRAFFKTEVPLRNILHADASTKQREDISPCCLVDGQICVNFAIFAPKMRGVVGGGRRNPTAIVWAFIGNDETVSWNRDAELTANISLPIVTTEPYPTTTAVSEIGMVCAPAPAPAPVPVPVAEDNGPAEPETLFHSLMDAFSGVEVVENTYGAGCGARKRRGRRLRIRVVTSRDMEYMAPAKPSPRVVSYTLFDDP